MLKINYGSIMQKLNKYFSSDAVAFGMDEARIWWKSVIFDI